ncbi:Flavin containing amine oxidoreductase [Microlunatus soli]|uniref:Flavin containing amine oxidoreductase n=1 Tax=Microlunatus soli TaxID=630515 RepID=A0A1H1PHK0_9ACTN|nr:Flavin containing amine oxidoreductase [Microlunatus soli]
MIGAGLAGMAAAARLAKARHRVTLLEARDRLGGAWAARELDETVVDAAPPIFSFPAPWRDLFRKSGRALEAEFARSGDELVDAEPTRHVFADGSSFVLPIGRGDQDAAISERFGRPVADRWRDLVDGLGDVWQALRPLGIEAELRSREQLTRPVKKALLHRQSVADLARRMDHPQLSAVITDLAYAAGSVPERTPAFCAVQLYLDRTFGRWTAGSGTTLISSLQQRLALRKVDVRTGTRATGIGPDGRTVSTEDGPLTVDAVVATCDPEQLYRDLLPDTVAGTERRLLRRLPGALRPTVTLDWAEPHPTDEAVPGTATPADPTSPDSTIGPESPAGPAHPTASDAPTETVWHRSTGGPLIEYTRPAAGRTVLIRHDYADAEPDRSAGVGWNGFRHWLDRPPASSEPAGLFIAGPSSRGGPAPSMQVLSGALAAYGCQHLIAPDRPLEPR